MKLTTRLMFLCIIFMALSADTRPHFTTIANLCSAPRQPTRAKTLQSAGVGESEYPVEVILYRA